MNVSAILIGVVVGIVVDYKIRRLPKKPVQTLFSRENSDVKDSN